MPSLPSPAIDVHEEHNHLPTLTDEYIPQFDSDPDAPLSPVNMGEAPPMMDDSDGPESPFPAEDQGFACFGEDETRICDERYKWRWHELGPGAANVWVHQVRVDIKSETVLNSLKKPAKKLRS